MFERTTFSPVYDYSELRGRIKSVLGTEGRFAKEIGRTHNFISKVFKGISYFDAKDVCKAAEVLQIDVNDIGFYFYTQKVCNSETF